MLKLLRITKTLGRFILLLLLPCIVSCATGNKISGTIGARHRIDPFPEKEEWVEITKNISKKTALKPGILWQVGIYQDNGVRLNFPGVDSVSNNLYYSEVDFSKDYFNYFDKKNISVFLTIEPGKATTRLGISRSLRHYNDNKSVKGICIDFDWVDDEVKSNHIISWYKLTKSINKNHYLMFKHWKIGKVPAVNREDIVYLNSMEGIQNRDDLLKRAELWYRFYYPAKVGYIVGYKKDQRLWANYSLDDFKNDLESRDIEFEFIFWSETNLEIIDK